jgi:hypothetical protein
LDELGFAFMDPFHGKKVVPAHCLDANAPVQVDPIFVRVIVLGKILASSDARGGNRMNPEIRKISEFILQKAE